MPLLYLPHLHFVAKTQQHHCLMWHRVWSYYIRQIIWRLLQVKAPHHALLVKDALTRVEMHLPMDGRRYKGRLGRWRHSPWLTMGRRASWGGGKNRRRLSRYILQLLWSNHHCEHLVLVKCDQHTSCRFQIQVIVVFLKHKRTNTLEIIRWQHSLFVSKIFLLLN